MTRLSARRIIPPILAVLLCGAAPVYRFEPMPQTVMFSNEGVVLGEERVAKKDDALLVGNVVDTVVAKIDRDIEFTGQGAVAKLRADDNLIPYFPSPDMTRDAALSGKVFCGTAVEMKLSALSKFQRAIGASFKTSLYFPCALDVDRDGTFDKAFVVGLTNIADGYKFADLPQVPYTLKRLQPDIAGSKIMINLSDVWSNPARAQLLLQIKFANGSGQAMNYYNVIQGGKVVRKSTNFVTEPKKQPYPVQFSDALGAAFTVLGADSKSKTIRYRIDRNFEQTAFTTGYQQPPEVRYIYLYLP